MIESALVLDKRGYPLFYHMPEGRTEGSLPDSPVLWEVIWNNREEISGIAHSHPGKGYPDPSYTDLTTFAAIEVALGKKLDWWIATKDRVTLIRTTTGTNYQKQYLMSEAFPWVETLRSMSRMEG